MRVEMFGDAFLVEGVYHTKEELLAKAQGSKIELYFVDQHGMVHDMCFEHMEELDRDGCYFCNRK